MMFGDEIERQFLRCRAALARLRKIVPGIGERLAFRPISRIG